MVSSIRLLTGVSRVRVPSGGISFFWTMYVYVLSLEKGCKYVGTTRDPLRRMEEHMTGKGSVWTRLHPPASSEYYKLVEFEEDEMAVLEEDRLTKELMLRYGVERVRGGIYVMAKLSGRQEDDVAAALRHARGECIKCGEKGHYMAQCQNEKVLLCSRCGEHGHRSAKCKKYPPLD